MNNDDLLRKGLKAALPYLESEQLDEIVQHVSTLGSLNDARTFLISLVGPPNESITSYLTAKFTSAAPESRNGSRKPVKYKSVRDVSKALADLDAAEDSEEYVSSKATSHSTASAKLTSKSQKKGRYCDCQARIHPLNTTAPNCLSCGKIICEYEVKGLSRSCPSCGAPLISREGAKLLYQNDPVLVGEFNRASARKEQLVNYDKTSTQRTKIIDQSTCFDLPDFEKSDKWATEEEYTNMLQAQLRHQQKLEKKAQRRATARLISIDMKGNRTFKTIEASSNSSLSDDASISEGIKLVSEESKRKKTSHNLPKLVHNDISIKPSTYNVPLWVSDLASKRIMEYSDT